MTRRRSARLTGIAGLASAALVLGACGGGEEAVEGEAAAPAEEVSEEEISAALEEPTELTFWTWVPDIEKEVAFCEEQYPNIDVEVVNVGQGAEHYQQLRAAIQAGQGAPDLVQIEYQHIPSFTLGNNLLDLSPYGVAEHQELFPEWVWNQVSRDGAVYAIPQDIGPMGMLYRNDIFEENNLEVPETYEEFAEAARTLHEANPEQFLTNLPPNDPGQVVGLLWQAGAKPFGYDGEETVTIDLTTPEVEQVMTYWSDLIQEGVIATDPDFNDAWYQGLANGRYASWLTAAWGPVFLQGTAGNTSGLWRAAELPQWEVDTSVAGNWGGSTNAVLESSENPIAAATMAECINVNPESSMMMATEQFLFPALEETLNSPEFVDAELEFYGGQQVNQQFAEIANTVDPEFGWLPFMDYAYNEFNETVGEAIANQQDLMPAVEAWEANLIEFAEAEGFTVE